MTTHTWGEDTQGTWTLELRFVGSMPQKGVLNADAVWHAECPLH